MNIVLKGIAFGFALCALLPTGFSQSMGNVYTSESGQQVRAAPLDDIVENTITMKRRVIPYDAPREADIFWKKRVWQLIDIREKMNLPFAYPQRPFLQILLDAAQNGTSDADNALPPMRLFKDEEFKVEMDTSDLNAMLFTLDTVKVTDPETYEERLQIVRNEIAVDDIKRYRVKEIWYFDKESSMMKVRILGFAPVKPIKADNGDEIGEAPMFWVYYPEAREYLAREQVFNTANDAAPMSWEDVMEMRYFSSYITKSSNVQDAKIQDQFKNRRDILMEAQKIKQEIFNFEQDLWTY